MPRPLLTDEQRTAVVVRSPRIFIEANPGSGKTTVAAERFGFIRFEQRAVGSQATTAVSFTRSATSELHRRIQGRWGSSALSWPHGVTTIDTLVFSIVQSLLRTGRIHWPGGHIALQVLDDWRGHQGFRWLPAGSYRRNCTVNANRTVTSTGVLVQNARFGFGNRAAFEQHPASGRCTHEDVRAVLSSALRVLHSQEPRERLHSLINSSPHRRRSLRRQSTRSLHSGACVQHTNQRDARGGPLASAVPVSVGPIQSSFPHSFATGLFRRFR